MLGWQSGFSTSTTGQTTYSTLSSTFTWRDGPLQSVISNAQYGAVNGTTTSTLSYDANGHLTQAAATGAQAKTVNYIPPKIAPGSCLQSPHQLPHAQFIKQPRSGAHAVRVTHRLGDDVGEEEAGGDGF
jgi:hypothetical protein